MSEPVGTDVSDAPLPWLGGSAGTQEKQAWSLSGDTLVVRYPFVRRDFYRQVFAVYKRMWWIFAFLGAIAAFMLFTMFHLARASGKVSPVNIILSSVLVLDFPVVTWVIAVATEKTMRGRVHQVTLSAAGISKRIEPVKGGETEIITPWANLRGISEWREDMLILPRFWLHAVAVPHRAFADAGAARRFHDAAVALWQSGGNMDAIPPSVRVEFAP